MEAQELALLAERERLMQDGHRQRGLEEELRRLQSEHDRYQPWRSPCPWPVPSVALCEAGWWRVSPRPCGVLVCLSLAQPSSPQEAGGKSPAPASASLSPQGAAAAGRDVPGARGAAG